MAHGHHDDRPLYSMVERNFTSCKPDVASFCQVISSNRCASTMIEVATTATPRVP